MARRKYTTRAEDIAFLRARLADLAVNWTVGDTCLSYDLRSTTTVAAIDGERVTLANGDAFHISRLRRAK